jgi:hypothetical protein
MDYNSPQTTRLGRLKTDLSRKHESIKIADCILLLLCLLSYSKSLASTKIQSEYQQQNCRGYKSTQTWLGVRRSITT